MAQRLPKPIKANQWKVSIDTVIQMVAKAEKLGEVMRSMEKLMARALNTGQTTINRKRVSLGPTKWGWASRASKGAPLETRWSGKTAIAKKEEVRFSPGDKSHMIMMGQVEEWKSKGWKSRNLPREKTANSDQSTRNDTRSGLPQYAPPKYS